MPEIRRLGRFYSALYGSPPPPCETEEIAAARWIAATEPCTACGRRLEPGDGYTCWQEQTTGRWHMYCADCSSRVVP